MPDTTSSTGNAPDGAAPPSADVQSARNILSKLHSLVQMVASDVEQHSSDVRESSRELSAFSEVIGGEDSILESAVASLESVIQNNERLEEQLSNTELALEHQKQLIDAHLTAALTDPLTGLPNRRAFDDALHRQIAQWIRLETPFSLVLVDLDEFKTINDQHGHLAGDAVLRGVSRMISAVLRDMDLVCRFGGDELAVILPGTDLASGENVTRRIQTQAAASNYSHADVVLSPSLSLGLATAQPGDTFEGILTRADQALYGSKEAGRNCTHAHDGTTCRKVV